METDALTETAREILGRIDTLQSRFGLYDGVDYRALVQSRDRQNYHLFGALRLTRRDEPHLRGIDTRPLLDPDLNIVEARLELGELDRFLGQTIKGHFYGLGPILGEREPYRVKVHIDIPEGSEMAFSRPELLPREDFEARFGTPWPGVSYFLQTAQQMSKFTVLQSTLEEAGFYRMEQALWHYVLNPRGEIPESPSLPGATGIFFALPNFHARLGRVTVAARTVTARVEYAEKVPLKDVSLTLQAFASPARGYGGFVLLPPKIWEAIESEQVEHTYATTPHHIKAMLHWAPGRNPAERFLDATRAERTQSLRPQMVAHALFDPDLKKLREALMPPDSSKADARDFEWAIATALVFCGFLVDWIGYKGGKRDVPAVDIIAYHPQKPLALVVECTVGQADFHRKLSSLLDRAARLQAELEGWEIKRVLATTGSSAAVQPYVEDSKRDDVILLTRDTLRGLMKAAEMAVPPDLLWQHLNKNLVDSGKLEI